MLASVGLHLPRSRCHVAAEASGATSAPTLAAPLTTCRPLAPHRAPAQLLLTVLDLETECVPAALSGAATPPPAGYESAPALRGRAVAEIELKLRKKGAPGAWRCVRRAHGTVAMLLSKPTPPPPPLAGLPNGGAASMRVVVDGFNAPLSAGNFVDLAASGAYNGTQVGRADGFVVQVGDAVKAPRKVPLEIRYKGRGDAPLYSFDAEAAGQRGGRGAAVALPFSSNGTVAVARDEAEPDSGGAAFFILLKARNALLARRGGVAARAWPATTHRRLLLCPFRPRFSPPPPHRRRARSPRRARTSSTGASQSSVRRRASPLLKSCAGQWHTPPSGGGARGSRRALPVWWPAGVQLCLCAAAR